MRRTVLGLAIVMLPFACGEDGATSGPVDARYSVEYVSDTGSEFAVDDDRAPVIAWAVDDSFQFSALESIDDGGGEVSIPDAPDGDYYVGTDEWMLVTPRRSLDLSRVALGRPDTTPGESGTTLRPILSNAYPDIVALMGVYSAGAGFHRIAQAMVQGDEVFAEFQFSRWPLVDATLGDELYAYQQTAEAIGGNTHRRTVRLFHATDVVMTTGVRNDVRGPLDELDELVGIRLQWDMSRFSGMLAAIHPEAEIGDGSRFEIITQPADLGLSDTGIPLVELEVQNTASPLDEQLSYASAALPDWRVVGALYVDAGRRYALPGVSDTFVSAPFVVYDDPSSFDGAVLAPRIGPPRAITVNGRDATQDLFDVGTTPTLQWEPPAQGEADYYLVSIFHLRRGDLATGAVRTRWIQTRNTWLTIPPDVLQAAQPYACRVTAVSEPNIEPDVEPLRTAPPRSSAAALTGIIAP